MWRTLASVALLAFLTGAILGIIDGHSTCYGWRHLDAEDVLAPAFLALVPAIALALPVGAAWRSRRRQPGWCSLAIGAGAGELLAFAVAVGAATGDVILSGFVGGPLGALFASAVAAALAEGIPAESTSPRLRRRRRDLARRAGRGRRRRRVAGDVAAPPPAPGLGPLDVALALVEGVALATVGTLVARGVVGDRGLADLLAALLPYEVGELMARLLLAGNLFALGAVTSAARRSRAAPAESLGRGQRLLVPLAGLAVVVLGVPTLLLP